MNFKQKKKDQLDNLIEQVLYGDHKDYFYTVNIEAGLGKTLAVEEALVNLYEIDRNKKTIFVTKFSDLPKYENCKEITDAVEVENKTSSGRINIQSMEKYGQNIALAINSSNYLKSKNIIKKYPVVVITHQMYKAISINSSKRKVFTEGRDILIIDEEIDIIEKLEYNKERINVFNDILPQELRSLYLDCIEPICTQLNKPNEKIFYNFKINDVINKSLKKLNTLLKTKITKQYIEELPIELKSFFDVENNIKTCITHEVDIIREFYQNTCIHENQNVYTFNSKIQYWFLENNILLDANAGFNACYSLSDKFKVSRQTKIVDHSKWTIHLCKENTTNNGKKKYINFQEQIKNLVNSNMVEGDKFLVITNKKEENELTPLITGVSFAHFGDLIGKNNWIEYNKLLIPHTPNIPFYVYVLKYLYYSGLKLGKRHKHSITTKDKVAVFNDEELDKVRKSYLAGELYQAIKRIDRNVNLDSHIYLINNDNEVTSIVVKQLKDVNVVIFDLELEQQPKANGGYNNDKRRESCYAVKFLELLARLDYGEYSKSWCMDQIQYNNKSNFAKDILGDDEVEEYLNENSHISTKGKNISILCNENLAVG